MGKELDKYDCWGLSLSLKPPITHLGHKHLCKSEPQFSSEQHIPKVHKPNSSTLKLMPKIMGVEVKPAPLVIDLEEVETARLASSPNSTLSSANGKRPFSGERDTISDDEDGSNGGCGGGERGERKKLRLSKEQIMVLEQAFKEHTTLNTKQKVALARQVNLRPRQVEVWFQNRRARTKLKQTEVDCEYLRKFCETLTEENRKLHKELQELRTLKVSPNQSSGHLNHPATTLSMCPSCKTVSLSSSASAFHQSVPLSLKKLSLTINSSKMFETHLPQP